MVVFLVLQFMAVYDYDAQASSPNKDSKEELSFKTGDVVVCYGKSREDGYYFGKVSIPKDLFNVKTLAPVRGLGRVVGNTLPTSEVSGLNPSPHPHVGKLVVTYQCLALYCAES